MVEIICSVAPILYEMTDYTILGRILHESVFWIEMFNCTYDVASTCNSQIEYTVRVNPYTSLCVLSASE